VGGGGVLLQVTAAAELKIFQNGLLTRVPGWQSGPRAKDKRPAGIQAMISHDGGKTWSQKEKLALAGQAPNWDAGYPSSLLRRDGKMLTVYYQVDELDKAPQSAWCVALIWQPPPQW